MQQKSVTYHLEEEIGKGSCLINCLWLPHSILSVNLGQQKTLRIHARTENFVTLPSFLTTFVIIIIYPNTPCYIKLINYK